MKIGFYAGSFDPFTNGHLHIIETSAKLFDKVIVGIGVNSQKTRRFDRNLMKSTIEKVISRKNLNNVIVVTYDNLSADTALEFNAKFLIRGIRNMQDYEFEENIASINQKISDLDTIYIRAGKFGNISSSIIMELYENGKDVSEYLPEEVLSILK